MPVIIGESGANENNAEEENGKYAEFLSTYSRKSGNICVMYWFSVIDRTTYEPHAPSVMNGLLKGKEL